MDKISEVIKYFSKQYKMHLEKNRTNKLLKRYYIEAKEDTRSTIAKIFDYVGVRIIIFFVIFLIVLVQYKNIYFSIITATSGTSLFHIVDIMIRNKRNQRIIDIRRRYFASQKVYKELIHKGIFEFNKYMQTVLEKTYFNIKDVVQISERNIIFYASFKGKDFVISCKKYNMDISVSSKEIEEFRSFILKEKKTNGIIITTSDFTKDCQTYLEQSFLSEKIILIDKEKLLKIIEKAGLFPTIKEVDEYTVDKMERKHKKIIAYREVLLAQNKAKSYVLLALLLLFWTKYTVFPLYYFTISMLLLVLSMITFYCNIKRNREAKEFAFEEILDKN